MTRHNKYDERQGAIRDHMEIFDSFAWYISPHLWTSVITDAGSSAVGDAAGGILVLLPSDASVADNDEIYVKSTNEVFKIGTDRAIVGECKLQYSEANVDDLNCFFGFADAIIADTLVDNGAGMKTSFSGAAIFKVDGGTVWKCISSNGSTQTISTSTSTAGGTDYQTLRIEFLEVDGTNMEVTFYLNGNPLLFSPGSGLMPRPIKHNVAIASATEMQIGVGAKNGAATNVETLNVDYIWALQTNKPTAAV